MSQSARQVIPIVLLCFVLPWVLALGRLDSKIASVEPGRDIQATTSTLTLNPTATAESDRIEKTATVERHRLPSIHYFTCLPCDIAKGQQSTLSWDLSGATAAYLDGHGVAAPGSTLVAPNQTTTYRLEAVGEVGSVERLVTVTVKEGGDPEAVSDALRRPGYGVRWVGFLPLAEAEDTISVIMTATTDDFYSQKVADQYTAGFKALYDNYSGEFLTVGLYDGVRYMLFVTVESEAFEAFLRGEIDGYVFWKAANWNIWDDWVGRWKNTGQDFLSKNFGY